MANDIEDITPPNKPVNIRAKINVEWFGESPQNKVEMINPV